MDTKIIIIDELNMDINKIQEAAKIIQKGGLVVFPTETVYGLGSDALNSDAVKKIYEAKGRPQDNPLIIHVGDKDIRPFVRELPEVARRLIDKFWPGPLTIILNKNKIIPDITSANLPTIGLRMPENIIALELIKASNTPIAAPSANISGRPSPTEVSRCIEDLSGRVDCIIGGKSSDVGLESTIVDCSVYPPCVLRPGAITLELLQEVDQRIYIDPHILKQQNGQPKAPGMKYRHYAPNASVKIINLSTIQKTINKINELTKQYPNKKIGIMATDETKDSYNNGIILSMGSRKDLASVAKNLFEVLRKFDDLKVDYILSEGFEESGIGLAIMNRLKKAASYDIVTE